jgi:hypothetical protein
MAPEMCRPTALPALTAIVIRVHPVDSFTHDVAAGLQDRLDDASYLVLELVVLQVAPPGGQGINRLQQTVTLFRVYGFF